MDQKEELEKLVNSLNLQESFDELTLQTIRDSVNQMGKEANDNEVEDVLNNCLIELNKLNSVESKGIIIHYLLGTLPVDLQKLLLKIHTQIIAAYLTKRLCDAVAIKG